MFFNFTSPCSLPCEGRGGRGRQSAQPQTRRTDTPTTHPLVAVVGKGPRGQDKVALFPGLALAALLVQPALLPSEGHARCRHDTGYHVTAHHDTPRHCPPQDAMLLPTTAHHVTAHHRTPRHCPPQHTTSLPTTGHHVTAHHRTPCHCPRQHTTSLPTTGHHVTAHDSTPRHCPPQHTTSLPTTAHHTIYSRRFPESFL